MQVDDRTQACHWMLLRLAGWVADGLLTTCRDWLMQGRLADVGLAASHAVRTGRVRLVDLDLELLTELCQEAGAEVTSLREVEVQTLEPIPMYQFSAVPPADGSATVGSGSDGDRVTQTAIDMAEAEPTVRGLWLAWRTPAGGAHWPPPRRVFLAETDASADVVRVTARLQRALDIAGEPDPQVEVYPVHAELPIYQQAARAAAGLLWLRAADREIRMATVFDGVHPQTGPMFLPDHPTVDDEERQRLLAYLYRGELLMQSTSLVEDVRNPALGRAVPLGFRTDGFWIWNEATTYYLERYGLAPDPSLLGHIRRRNHVFDVDALDGATIHRAMEVLRRPVDEEAAWVFG
ncbi:hypothetical protein GCM10027290_62320 [Micromonospora sonneratiae]|uniref:Uncharacterized protein n=1 Tax=Micromonospora sonneratiae TaxID=1184706 RepID=A0ABW3YD16_9ACTN